MTTTDLHRDEVLELDPTRLALVGDVGGTNARFALVDPDLDPTRLISAMSLRCKDYATPAAAIADFVARTGLGRLPTFAVIAGTRSLALSNPTSWTVGRRFPPGVANDGTVAVEETKLPGMADFAEVDATHTWIMNAPIVHRLVCDFLARGKFTVPPQSC